MIATRGARYVLAYTYTGKPFVLRPGVLRSQTVRASWYDPRDGSRRTIGSFSDQGVRRFVPPGKPGPGNDWVLVVEG